LTVVDEVGQMINLDRLAIAAAAAALRDREYFEQTRAKVLASRSRLVAGLEKRGFATLPTQANFVMAKPPAGAGPKDVYLALKERKVLVRYFPDLPEFIRITVGTDDEIGVFFRELDALLKGVKQ